MRNRNFSGGFREPSGSWEANHEERMRKMEQEKAEKLKNPYIFLDDAIRDVAAKTEARQKIEMFISSLPAELPETLRQDILRTRIGIELINGDYFFTSFAHDSGLADAWGLDSSRVVSRDHDHDVTGMRKDRPPQKNTILMLLKKTSTT